MADIAFLLVIYFMLTTAFSVSAGLDFRPDHLGLPEGIQVALPTEREQQRFWL